MSEREDERKVESISVEPRAEWIGPEVDRLIAGGAEAAGDTSTDGIDTLS